MTRCDSTGTSLGKRGCSITGVSGLVMARLGRFVHVADDGVGHLLIVDAVKRRELAQHVWARILRLAAFKTAQRLIGQMGESSALRQVRRG
jgi:hypothetical protein